MRAFFLPGHGGNRFCVFHTPAGELRGALLYVHPLAEEMNLSRRMAALQARAFAAAGYAVLQMDLFGCGDSAGDFAEASWGQWRDDVLEAACWLQGETGWAPLFWGLRAGCLLADEAARMRTGAAEFIFWQPVVSGEQHWRQWARLRLGRDLLASGADTPALQPETIIELGGMNSRPHSWTACRPRGSICQHRLSASSASKSTRVAVKPARLWPARLIAGRQRVDCCGLPWWPGRHSGNHPMCPMRQTWSRQP